MEGAKSSSATNSRQGVFPKSQPGDKSTSNSTAPSSSREQQRNKNEQANRVKGGGLASSGPAANGGGGTPRWGSGTSASKSCTRESSDAAADPGSRQSPRPSDKNTKVFEDKRGRTLSVNSNQPGMKGTDRLSAHSEEDLLKGLTLQAIWSENVELTSLMNAALKIARLSPTASDLDWNESYHTFLQLFSMSKARLARQKSILQARQRDLEDILADERSIRQSVEDVRGIMTFCALAVNTMSRLEDKMVCRSSERSRRRGQTLCGLFETVVHGPLMFLRFCLDTTAGDFATR
nr:hypothetical protein TgIa.0840 [Toxoplasma gondii RH]